MPKGAIHFTGTNFARRRRLRWDILDRMRKLIENGTYKRPRWMDWVEANPPLETRNLLHTDRVIRNPYIPLIQTLLNKYPDLRFEGCFNPGNEWQKGYDNYTHDHPVMQFVAHQLSLMHQGIDRQEAFRRTEQMFYKKRMEEENEAKISMALGLDRDVKPQYTTGIAYYKEKMATDKINALTHIRNELRKMRAEVTNEKAKTFENAEDSTENKTPVRTTRKSNKSNPK